MRKDFKIFITGIMNSLRADSYHTIVPPNRNLGEIATKIDYARKKNFNKIKREIYAKTREAKVIRIIK